MSEDLNVSGPLDPTEEWTSDAGGGESEMSQVPDGAPAEGAAAAEPEEIGETSAAPGGADFELPPPLPVDSLLTDAPRPTRARDEDLTTNNDDQLMGALAWAATVLFQLPLVSVVLLLAEGNKNRPFQRHHAITSLVFWGVAVVYEILAGIVFTILTVITLGCLGLLLWVIFFLPHLAMLYYAYQAYNGKTLEIPFVSEYARKQGWL